MKRIIRTVVAIFYDPTQRDEWTGERLGQRPGLRPQVAVLIFIITIFAIFFRLAGIL